MDSLTYKTISANKETVDKNWVIVDASGHALGRMCSKIAKLIRGKYKPSFTPHVDCGDNVIVINAEKITLSGNKWESRRSDYIRRLRKYGKRREGKSCRRGQFFYDWWISLFVLWGIDY